MKISVEWIVDSLLITFFIVLVMGLFNIASQINAAYNYHHYMTAQISQSHFDQGIMEMMANSEKYRITYTDCTIDHDLEFYPKEQLYQVETEYTIKLPIIGYQTTNKIISYAR